MKIITMSFLFVTLCIHDIFAEEGEFIVDCPNPQNGIDCTHEPGLGEIDCKATFKVTLGNKEISITPAERVRAPKRIYGLDKVQFTQHSALLNSMGSFFKCAVTMRNDKDTTPLEFTLSWLEVEQEVKKIAPKAILNQRSCEELAQGAKCTYQMN